jgi:hypothetical protein
MQLAATTAVCSHQQQLRCRNIAAEVVRSKELLPAHASLFCTPAHSFLVAALHCSQEPAPCCRGTRPAPPRGRADLPLFVTLYKDRMILYRDMSGESLHRRGYRDALHKAPLNEAAAAGAPRAVRAGCDACRGWAGCCWQSCLLRVQGSHAGTKAAAHAGMHWTLLVSTDVRCAVAMASAGQQQPEAALWWHAPPRPARMLPPGHAPMHACNAGLLSTHDITPHWRPCALQVCCSLPSGRTSARTPTWRWWTPCVAQARCSSRLPSWPPTQRQVGGGASCEMGCMGCFIKALAFACWLSSG